MDDDLGATARLHAMLRAGGRTVATAESLTGGALAARLTDVPGASITFLGGVVSYATELKVTLLGVPEEVVTEAGVVSAECAEAMAAGIRRITGATYALATTGVAGPDTQEGKPAGTVYLGIATPGETTSVRLALDGDRRQIRDATCALAIAELVDVVRREEPAVG